MLDNKSIVRVVGQPDITDNVWDFDKYCTLEESIHIAINRWKDVFVIEKREGYYSINICYGLDCVYYIDNYGINISESYKDIVNFKNLDLSDIPFQKYSGRRLHKN